MRKGVLVLVVVLVLLLGAGGVAIVSYTTTRSGIRQALRDAATRYGLDPDWLEAVGLTESNLRPATNTSGADGARGGAWGPTQITERTARAYGYTGSMQALNDDPGLAGEWTARIASAALAERGAVKTFENLCALWNAGKLYSELPAGHVTRTTYVPRAERHLASLRGVA